MNAKTAELTPVQMTDGRVVNFTTKKRLDKTLIKNEDGSLQVRLDWRNGETRLFTLRPDMIADYALHGAGQKLGDETAGIDDLEDAIEAVDQLILRLDNGEWNMQSTGGSGMAGASILARALVEATGQPIATVRAYLSQQTDKVKRAMRIDPSVAPIIKRLEDEKAARQAARGKAAPTVDVSGLIAGLAALRPAA